MAVEEISNGRVQYFFHNREQVQSFIDKSSSLKKYSYEEVDYHFSQCIQSGYIRGDVGAQYGFSFSDLTPTGHAFLNTIRSNTIWKQTKDKIKPLGTVSINVISQVAAAFAKDALGL